MFAISYLCDDPTMARHGIGYAKHPHVFAIDPVDFKPIDADDVLRISAWCTETFGGTDADTWAFIPYFMFFTFKSADDAFAFRMRWC